MPTSKKRSFERKSPKQYQMRSFTDPVYGEEFTLPSLDQAPLRVPGALNKMDLEPMEKWFRDAGVSDEEVQAILDLDPDEFGKFSEAWQDGEISVPKSAA